MAELTIRGIDDEVRDRLRIRAAQHGRSMEAEARAILTAAVSPVEAGLIDSLVAFGRELRASGHALETLPRDEPLRAPFA